MSLRDVLINSRYFVDDVMRRLGEAGQSGLWRNSTVPAEIALRESSDPQATLIKLFLLHGEVPKEDAEFLLAFDEIVEETAAGVRARVEIRPYGEGHTWIVCDLQPGYNSTTTATRPDYVLGVSPASTTLAELTMRRPVRMALDLGCGCGVQALHLAQHAQRVVATDINPRALKLAQLSAELSGVEVDLRQGSLFEPVSEQFDLIVSNPPYVMSPDSLLTYRETNFAGDGLLKELLQTASDHLCIGGSMQLLTNWAVVAGQPWEDRLREMIEPTGLDVWILERERLDIYTYIEMWLTDAGLAGSSRWRTSYDRWVSYFEELGIEAVGMGWILATKANREEAHIRIESWPYSVQQPIGEVFANHAEAVSLSRLPLAEFLQSRLVLAEVQEERIYRPGAEHPYHIVFRQQSGLRRAMTADTALAGLFGVLDGGFTVGQAIAALARSLEVDGPELAAELIPKLRQAVEEQYLLLEK